MIGEGMTVSFVPSFAPKSDWAMDRDDSEYVTGTIDYINWEHKHFIVVFDCGGIKMRESFKFSQIGKDITVLPGKR